MKAKLGINVKIGGKSDQLRSHCWSRVRMSFTIRERETSYCLIRSPLTYHLLETVFCWGRFNFTNHLLGTDLRLLYLRETCFYTDICVKYLQQTCLWCFILYSWLDCSRECKTVYSMFSLNCIIPQSSQLAKKHDIILWRANCLETMSYDHKTYNVWRETWRFVSCQHDFSRPISFLLVIW